MAKKKLNMTEILSLKALINKLNTKCIYLLAMKCEQEPSCLTESIFYHMHFMIVAFCNLDFKWFNLQIPYRFHKLGGIGSYHLQTTVLRARFPIY